MSRRFYGYDASEWVLRTKAQSTDFDEMNFSQAFRSFSHNKLSASSSSLHLDETVRSDGQSHLGLGKQYPKSTPSSASNSLEKPRKLKSKKNQRPHIVERTRSICEQ